MARNKAPKRVAAAAAATIVESTDSVSSSLPRLIIGHLLFSLILTTALHFAGMRLTDIINPSTSTSNISNSSNTDQCVPAMAQIIPKETAAQVGHNETVAEAAEYFAAATQFSGSSGEGRKGWLYLLASYDLDASNDHTLRSLVQNYHASGFTDLAIDELFNVLRVHPKNRAARSLLVDVKRDFPDIWKTYQSRLNEKIGSEFSNLLNPPVLTLPFSTVVAQYMIGQQFPDMMDLNIEFYDATMIAYAEVAADWRKKQPDITETQINNKFFQWQMQVLKETGEYWEGYRSLPLFKKLILLMREAAANFLVTHGMDPDKAIRKASHNIIFWASVHTGDSIHGAHVTEDALIGGVYYVSVPPRSGKLGIFDPRGKSPIMDSELTEMSRPPFHRTLTLTPEEGMMVLFPGWLVHTVLPSRGLNVHTSKYRISISVNLKGEWQDTGGLHLRNVQVATPDLSKITGSTIVDRTEL